MKTSSYFPTIAFLLWGCTLAAHSQPEQTGERLPFPKFPPERAAQQFIPAQPLTLHLKNVTFQEALSELSKQSGVPIEKGSGYEAFNKKLSLDIETTSFWKAFYALLEEVDVQASLDKSGGHRSWYVSMDGDDTYPDAAKSGQSPFEVRALSINTSSSKSVTTGATPRRDLTEEASATLFAQPDPRIPLAGGPIISVTRAEDDKGHSLLTENSNQPWDFPWPWSQKSEISLDFPSPGSQKLAHLDGKVTYVFATKYDNWELSDVQKAKNPTHDFQSSGRTIRITLTDVQLVAISRTRSQLQLSLEVLSLGTPLEDGVSSPLLRGSQLLPLFRIKDANGREFTTGAYDYSSDENKLKVQANFVSSIFDDQPEQPVTAPISLSLNAPVEFAQTEVPFSFSNLPLP